MQIPSDIEILLFDTDETELKKMGFKSKDVADWTIKLSAGRVPNIDGKRVDFETFIEHVREIRDRRIRKRI